MFGYTLSAFGNVWRTVLPTEMRQWHLFEPDRILFINLKSKTTDLLKHVFLELASTEYIIFSLNKKEQSSRGNMQLWKASNQPVNWCEDKRRTAARRN